MDHNTQTWLAQAANRYFITPSMAEYPDTLREINNPPKQLFVEGNLAALHDPQLAIVGSRRMTPYGKQNAFHFAKDLAQKGVTITSGLATGIDGEAHKGALAASGQTIAVLGAGLDIITPTHHRALAKTLVEQGGALVSELPLGTQPNKFTFPLRNRIITGLSLGVLIVEAALKSGTLVSARLANEQGREVFVIPGSIHSPLSRGCHMLLTQGAKLTQSSADILLELQAQLHLAMDTQDQKTTTSQPAALNQEDTLILQHIGYEPASINSIVHASNLSPEVVASTILMLELNGHVQSVPGGYIKTSGNQDE